MYFTAAFKWGFFFYNPQKSIFCFQREKEKNVSGDCYVHETIEEYRNTWRTATMPASLIHKYLFINQQNYIDSVIVNWTCNRSIERQHGLPVEQVRKLVVLMEAMFFFLGKNTEL